MNGYIQQKGKCFEGSLENTKKKFTSLNEKIPTRYVLAIMSFFGSVVIFTMRVNLSVAIVAMTNTNVGSAVNTSCPIVNNTNQRLKKYKGEFNWNSNEQGLILASFYYGYACTQLIGGWLAKWEGGKLLLGGGILWTAVLTLLTPVAARFSLAALVAVRILQGLGQGVTFPAMHAIWGNWAPASERSRLITFTYSGQPIGALLALAMSGVLIESNIMGGWPSVFYVFGVLGVIWFIAWMLLTSSTPAQHPRISREERSYIETSLNPNKRLSTPWLSILTSPQVWAINIGHFCFDWYYFLMLSCLPLYMKDVLGFDISENGLLSAVPHLSYWLLTIGSGILADFLRKKYLSTTVTRKLMNSLGLLIPAVIFITIKYVGCDRDGALTLVIMSVASSAFSMAGYLVNHLDIAHNFAGTLMGFSMTLGTIPGFVAPTVVGYMTGIPDVREGWLRVFYLSAGINVFGAIFYIIFASGEEQKWAVVDDTETDSILNSHQKENGTIIYH